MEPAPNRDLSSWLKLAPWILVAAGLLCYANSFSVPFLLDDHFHIVDNHRIRTFQFSQELLFGTTRPVVNWTLALNYAWGGLSVWGYHAFNLVIHLVAGGLLFGILRRTLQTPLLQKRFGAAATPLALAASLLWLIHPLQTQAVTYIIQRSEALMGLFWLLALYAVIRLATSQHKLLWWALAVVACGLGMGCKPVMVTAPLVILLYDKIFLAGSWKTLWRQRAGLHLDLFSTWCLLGAILLAASDAHLTGAGFHLEGVTQKNYLLTQPGVLLHYLKLVFWPNPLVLDYQWNWVENLRDAWIPTASIGLLILATLWGLVRRPAIGFLGAWFLLALAPSSSFIPLADPIFEHRMYLGLAAPVLLVILLGHQGLQLALSTSQARQPVAFALVVLLAASAGATTWHRNADYQTTVSIWQDTVTKQPSNVRALVNLGGALHKAGRVEEAVGLYQRALALAPNHPDAHNNLGFAFANQGKLEEAKQIYLETLKLQPNYAKAHRSLGTVLLRLGEKEEALTHLRKSLELDPTDAISHNELGTVLFGEDNWAEAGLRFAEAVRLNPRFAEAHNNLGAVYSQQGKLREAVQAYAQALKLKPDYPDAKRNLQAVLDRLKQLQSAR